MPESFFDEMKRYVRFEVADEEALRELAPRAAPHFESLTREFYDRLREHEEARAVLEGEEQVARLRHSLDGWLRLLLTGPWNREYHERRVRIGRVHVAIGLPQRYMFGAMDLIRISLTRIAQDAYGDDAERRVRTVWALAKILDIELAIMLESYREAFVEKVQRLERLEREVLQDQLALSEARYQEIVETSEALISTFEASGAIVLFNRRCEEATGLSRSEVLGRSWLDLFVARDKHALVRSRFHEVLSSRRVPPFEGMVTHASGAERRVRWHFTTLPGAQGPLLCAVGMDVTDEHDLALRTGRAERLASLGTMAAGLAHEIRNPLNAASLQLLLLQRRLRRPTGPDVDGALQAADVVGGEMKRLAFLVEEFLEFARPQPLRLARLGLRGTVGQVLELLEPEAASAGVELTLLPGAEFSTEIDQERIKQVVLNLVRNAMEAAGRGGRVRVRVGAAEGGAVLEVEDDGPGLPPETAMIFEPFFTTKPGGTGLGLAIVHRIVTDHGGRIDAERRGGTTAFSVFLPSAIAEVAH